ncbi:MAG: transposase [candidate division NC10 bacterium]|nr:transposase [candidate division NC10 bacterium]
MPRQARLDAPGVLHHVMVRGLERRPIFRDDAGRRDFCARLGALVDAAALTVYAWALLPNHAHLLLRTGGRPLARCMRSLLTGYAGAFNRRHRRVGHLFQNRYKSIVVEEEPYLLELVRYVHPNPLRAGVVPELRALDRYPWTGHSALLGTRPRPWQATGAILQHFGPTPARARKAYRVFVADGIPRGRRPELQGGGLIRSLGGWRAVAALRRGREAYLGDERILGGAEFVEQCRREAAQAHPPPARRPAVATLLSRVCAATGCPPPALHHGSRRARAARAREGLAYLALEVYGYPASAVDDLLGVRPPAVYRAAQRGRADRGRWDRLLKAGEAERNIRKQRPG